LQVIVVIFVLYFAVITTLASPRQSSYTVGEAHGVTLTPGTRFMIYSAATVAFGWPTSFDLQKRGVEWNGFERNKNDPSHT
jgi:hypothetical protein